MRRSGSTKDVHADHQCDQYQHRNDIVLPHVSLSTIHRKHCCCYNLCLCGRLLRDDIVGEEVFNKVYPNDNCLFYLPKIRFSPTIFTCYSYLLPTSCFPSSVMQALYHSLYSLSGADPKAIDKQTLQRVSFLSLPLYAWNDTIGSIIRERRRCFHCFLGNGALMLVDSVTRNGPKIVTARRSAAVLETVRKGFRFWEAQPCVFVSASFIHRVHYHGYIYHG